ncbi:hypothetical protein [Kibdelosporangium philippinense]
MAGHMSPYADNGWRAGSTTPPWPELPISRATPRFPDNSTCSPAAPSTTR